MSWALLQLLLTYIHLHIDPHIEIQFKIVNPKKKKKTFRVGELSLRLA